jgi:uncharacterized damage-inducible protein DinB
MDQSLPDPNLTLARFLDGPHQLETALRGVTSYQLDAPPTPPGWTIRQTAHHIVDGDDLWKLILKAAIGEPETGVTLQWYWEKAQDEWANDWAYETRPLEADLALFKANRAHVSQLVTTIPNAWHRSVTIHWPDQQSSGLTVGNIVQMQADHALDHVTNILKMRRSLESATGPPRESE